MPVILCGRFYSNDVAVASYGNQIRAKYTLKWGVQIMGSHFGASSETEAEQKEFMKAFIERIEMFPEKRKDGSWIKKIVFNFPVPVEGEEVKELPLETETTVESIALLSGEQVQK